MKNFIYRKLNRLFLIYRARLGYSQKIHYEKIALHHFKGAQKILDIGCGIGRFIANDPQRITGLDHNPKSIEICKQKGYQVTQGEATQLPFENLSFDAIFVGHLIEHLLPQDAHQLLKEINRVLKRGGVIALTSPLMSKDFYNDLTHIKPYPPRAIFHYLNIKLWGKETQFTLGELNCLYKVLHLKYRHRPFFKYIEDSSIWYLAPIFLIIRNILERFQIGTRRNGYLLVMRKIK